MSAKKQSKGKKPAKKNPASESMHRTILVGSPNPDGRSAYLADLIFNASIEDRPLDGVSIVSARSIDISGCIGCEACAAKSQDPYCTFEEGDWLSPVKEVEGSDCSYHMCFMTDDMVEVRKHIDAADQLIVVCPVYFASVPSQFKALLDRLQPYYHSDLRRFEPRECIVHMIREGGDPFGYDPYLTTLQSALSVAGFEILQVLDWMDCFDEAGQVLKDPKDLGSFSSYEDVHQTEGR